MSDTSKHTLFVVYGPAARLTRTEALKLIWRHTHRDFKGTTAGTRTVLTLRGATTLIPLAELTTAEIVSKLDACWAAEQRRIAKPPRRVRDKRAPMDVIEIRKVPR